MQAHPRLQLSQLGLLAAAAAAVVAGVTMLLFPSRPAEQTGLPSDCGATPSAYHPGEVADWPASARPKTASGPGDGASAELFARVRFDTGRMVLAYNATPGRPPVGSRVVVAEYRCVHRTIHLLTELGAPAAPSGAARPETKGH